MKIGKKLWEIIILAKNKLNFNKKTAKIFKNTQKSLFLFKNLRIIDTSIMMKTLCIISALMASNCSGLLSV